MKLGLGSLLGAAVLAAVSASGALANSPRVTRGDAEAVFQAIGGTGATMLHSPTLQGAPDEASLTRIRAFGGSNGQHFCSLDWHVVGLQLGDVGPYKAAAANIDAFTVAFTLDGAALPSRSTALKRWDPQDALALFGSDEVFFRGYGAILAPDALPAGTHTVTVAAVNSETGESLTGGATFFMDPAGAGTCA
jgi:hypothetical protein